MLVMFSVPLPVLVSVTLLATLVVPTAWLAKLRPETLKLTAGAMAVAPVPVKATACGEPAALSLIVIVPVRVPVAVGVNVTLIAQPDPAARVAPHVVASA